MNDDVVVRHATFTEKVLLADAYASSMHTSLKEGAEILGKASCVVATDFPDERTGFLVYYDTQRHCDIFPPRAGDLPLEIQDPGA